MNVPKQWSGRRRAVALAGAGALVAALVGIPATAAHAAVACGVTYSVNTWTESPGVGGFTANLTINNLGDPVTAWTMRFSFPSTTQSLTPPGWSANWSQSGQQMTATPLDWNRTLGTGGSTTIGFNGRWTGSNPNPTSFSLNNVVCTGSGGGNQAPTVSLTSPTNGQSFAAGAPIPMAANASDPDGTINRVEFLIDGAVVGTDTSSPYTFSATNVASGNHNAAARAVDNGNPAASTTSTSVPFSVGGGGTPALVAAPSSVNIVEGGSATLNIKLSQSPSATVPVTLTKTGDADITVTPTSISLTQANFASGVNVTVAAAEDADQTADSASIAVAGPGVTGTTVSVSATDNDGGGGGGGHVDNPFVGATGYASADYANKLESSAVLVPAATAAKIRSLKTVPTAVWLDRIAAIDGTPTASGLRAHLNAALTQKQGNTPITATFVVYDLPNRDCAALASNGELLIAQNGLNRYKTEYVDRIASIVADPAYAGIRIVLIVEPDSIPNLVTNLSTPACAEAEQTGAYVEGVRYAISKLTVPDNAYLYLDVAHSGWLGWPNNFDGAVNRYQQLINSPGPGWASIDGFISNTANYTPVEEPFLPNPDLNIGGDRILNTTFYEFNPNFDERDFVTALRNRFVANGAPSTIGMLIDTSRNGWGGTARPTAVSSSTDRNTYVNESKIDRRPHRGGWCNQNGAGLGFRPTATPFTGVDAYIWIKPPGESDGVATAGVVDPDDPAKKFDAMCDPNARNRYNNAFPTNALPGAPHAGRWFHDQLVQLVNNAFPAL